MKRPSRNDFRSPSAAVHLGKKKPRCVGCIRAAKRGSESGQGVNRRRVFRSLSRSPISELRSPILASPAGTERSSSPDLTRGQTIPVIPPNCSAGRDRSLDEWSRPSPWSRRVALRSPNPYLRSSARSAPQRRCPTCDSISCPRDSPTRWDICRGCGGPGHGVPREGGTVSRLCTSPPRI